MKKYISPILSIILLLWACDDDQSKKINPSLDQMPTADAQLLDMTTDQRLLDQALIDQKIADQAIDSSMPQKSDIWKDIPLEGRESWKIPELEGKKSFVIYTEGKVPNIYAENEKDLAILTGFILAKDRFFNIDLVRRVGLGELSQLLGDVSLSSDLDFRTRGMRYVAQRICSKLSPQMQSYFDHIAIGMNYYIDQVKAQKLPTPLEYTLASALFRTTPTELMKNWSRLDYCGITSVLMYQTNYETEDIGRTGQVKALEEIYPNDPIRKNAYLNDIALNLKPFFEDAISVPQQNKSLLPLSPTTINPLHTPQLNHLQVPKSALLSLYQRLKAFDRIFKRDRETGFGSNAWSVGASLTNQQGALIAGDGHLELAAPSLMYQIGLNTKYLGGGNIEQKGLFITGLPLLAVGTNGKIAWSQVNPNMDIIDWYQEEIQLNESTGIPQASYFKGEWKPLAVTEDQIDIADRPALNSVGRTLNYQGFRTFDGRWIADIEGISTTEDAMLLPGQFRMRVQGQWVIPQDVDQNGKIWAISFDYAAFDAGSFPDALAYLGQAQNVEELNQRMKGFIGGGLYLAGGDDQGNILYSSYQTVPCRGNLPKTSDGSTWLAGANPMLLLDGTQYGGFEIPVKDNQIEADEAAFEPSQGKCAIPFDQMPAVINPSEGYAVTANNAPLPLENDGSLENDTLYLGGTWDSVRAHSIMQDLKERAMLAPLTYQDMSAVQSNHRSRLGEAFTPYLLADIDLIKSIDIEQESNQQKKDSLNRAKAIYLENQAAIDEALTRLDEWKTHGYQAESGVETFYHQPNELQKKAAVAVMIFNAYFRQLIDLYYADEATVIPTGGIRIQVSALRRAFSSKGENREGLIGFDDQYLESIFFDDLRTSNQREFSFELNIKALSIALSQLSAVDGFGFGTQDQSQWLWGLRHQAKFQSLLAPFLGDGASGSFDVLLSQFEITTSKLPLMPNLPNDDPRKALKWFPRHSDQWNVDACNSGLGLSNEFSCGSGPAMRMAIQLHQGKVSGVNIIPGGQSGNPNSPNYKDQLKLWLGNEAYPLRYHVEEVVEGAITQDIFSAE